MQLSNHADTSQEPAKYQNEEKMWSLQHDHGMDFGSRWADLRISETAALLEHTQQSLEFELNGAKNLVWVVAFRTELWGHRRYRLSETGKT